MTRAPFQGVPQSDYKLFHPEKKRGTVILAIRTDKPLAELYLYEDKKEIGQLKWQAHRELSNTIHSQIDKLLNKPAPHQNLSGVVGSRIMKHQVFGAGSSISWDDIKGIVCFAGPGSFTGLRIGLSVANAMSYANQIPIVARRGDNWLKKGIKDLEAGKDDKIAMPKYGSPPHITRPKK